MNYIITGEPRSGKSTLIKKIWDATKNKQGFITLEKKENDQRVGFDILTSGEKTYELASIYYETPIQVSRYFVDTSAIEKALKDIGPTRSNTTLIIDEIGQMQLYSDVFRTFVQSCLNSDNTVIATLSSVYQDSLIEDIKSREDTQVYTLTPENREELTAQLLQKLTND